MWYTKRGFKKTCRRGWRLRLLWLGVKGDAHNLCNSATGWSCLNLYFVLLITRQLVIYMRMFHFALNVVPKWRTKRKERTKLLRVHKGSWAYNQLILVVHNLSSYHMFTIFFIYLVNVVCVFSSHCNTLLIPHRKGIETFLPSTSIYISPN